MVADLLLEWADRIEQPDFIALDPLSLPRRFADDPASAELVGFMAATIAWGSRPSIIKSAERALAGMGERPVQWLLEANDADLAALPWRHRTLMAEDALTLLQGLQRGFRENGSLAPWFAPLPGETSYGPAIDRARTEILGVHIHSRTAKHFASPAAGSAAKRLHLFLRWMVRPATRGVDLGIWSHLPKNILSCPLDVHTGRVARGLGLLHRTSDDARAVHELDLALRQIDPEDPARLDFALFGLGLEAPELWQNG
jgi:uncharacterized protein (TIGR02757 family)